MGTPYNQRPLNFVRCLEHETVPFTAAGNAFAAAPRFRPFGEQREVGRQSRDGDASPPGADNLDLEDSAACYASRRGDGRPGNLIDVRVGENRPAPIDGNSMAFPAGEGNQVSSAINAESHGVLTGKGYAVAIGVEILQHNGIRGWWVLLVILAILFRITGEAAGPALFGFSQVRCQGHGAVGKTADEVTASSGEMVSIIVEAGKSSRGGVSAHGVEDIKPRANFVTKTAGLVVARPEAEKCDVASLGAHNPPLDARHHACPGARTHRVDAVHEEVGQDHLWCDGRQRAFETHHSGG